MGLEIIRVVDAVSETKDMDREIIFEAIENALESATKKKYDYNLDVKVKIDRLSGDYNTYRRWMVFADESRDLEDPDIELRMIDAIDVNKDAQPGEYVEEEIDSGDDTEDEDEFEDLEEIDDLDDLGELEEIDEFDEEGLEDLEEEN